MNYLQKRYIIIYLACFFIFLIVSVLIYQNKQSEFIYIRDKMVEIYTDYDIVPYNQHPDYEETSGSFMRRYLHAIEFARKNKTGQCRMRANILSLYYSEKFGYDFEYLGFENSRYRNVAMFNTPVQGNHSAIDILVDGYWTFFDPAFGIYFTDTNDQPIGFKKARSLFPNLIVNKYDKKNKSWKKYGPKELAGDPIFLHFSPLGSDRSWPNAHLQRLYFNVDAHPDIPRRSITSAIENFKPTEVSVVDTLFTELDIVLNRTGRQEITLFGENLDRVIFDIDHANGFYQTVEDSIIDKSPIIDKKMSIQFNSLHMGSVLKIRPTAQGNSFISKIEWSDSN